MEESRVLEYHKRNYTWPPSYHPDTPGWKSLLQRRFQQMTQIPDRGNRYDGYMNAVNSAYVVPNFTENGWGMIRAPEELVTELRQAVRDGYATRHEENFIPVIEGVRPYFIDNDKLMDKVLRALKPLHEKWSGVPLVGNNAYGLRLYRNESHLNMHSDKPSTHVISCILHIDRSADAEPWPLVIEDFKGNTNEVYLEPGDLLFYESSKCLHGRPIAFHGSWYTSVFVHYYPLDWDTSTRELESHYGIPPHWDDVKACYRANGATSSGNNNGEMSCQNVETLVMVGTSMKEPECTNNWCALQQSVKRFGPAPKDKIVTADGVFPF
eukprot:CAMPEP_0172489630 /NCGR_PEP_ID=MMETSP1066-20121228/19765_1 /TAXON_ID=671091 /ORGANISM="Coscinodiscus wailesii, Strain CCMP2513" /LENGTH=323 /DNA_ID=CAMNT_0013257631 /DNA_START=174 /DNA_END=1145 /DNA_ORIENTATION=+